MPQDIVRLNDVFTMFTQFQQTTAELIKTSNTNTFQSVLDPLGALSDKLINRILSLESSVQELSVVTSSLTSRIHSIETERSADNSGSSSQSGINVCPVHVFSSLESLHDNGARDFGASDFNMQQPSPSFGSKRVIDLPESERNAFINDLAACGGLEAHELSALLFPDDSSEGRRTDALASKAATNTTEKDTQQANWEQLVTVARGPASPAPLSALHGIPSVLHDSTNTQLSRAPFMPFGSLEAQTGALSEETESEECFEPELEEGTAETPYGFGHPLSAVSSSSLGLGIASCSVFGHKSPP